MCIFAFVFLNTLWPLGKPFCRGTIGQLFPHSQVHPCSHVFYGITSDLIRKQWCSVTFLYRNVEHRSRLVLMLGPQVKHLRELLRMTIREIVGFALVNIHVVKLPPAGTSRMSRGQIENLPLSMTKSGPA